MKNQIQKTIEEHGITENDLRSEYESRWDSKYLEECTLEKLVHLMINEQVYGRC